MQNDSAQEESAVNIMDTDQINLSPARRSKRCVLCLLAFCTLLTGAYVGLHPDYSPFMENGSIVASDGAPPELKSSPAPTQQADSRKEAPIKVSMRDSIASAYLVTPSTH